MAYLTPNDVAERLQLRQSALTPEFSAKCAVHGITLFDTMTGACLACLAQNANLPIIARYRAALGVYYADKCTLHGVAPYHFSRSLCAHCYDERGRLRKARPGNPERVAARQEGRTSYLATCATHGRVPHHTARGRCLSCFNSLGYPRKR